MKSASKHVAFLMYFLRIEKLKNEIAARPFSDREILPYLATYVGLSSAAVSLPEESANLWDNLGAAWSVTLAVIATIYIYRQNRGADGHHFLQRYFVIGWVVARRCLLAIVAASIPFYAVVAAFGIVTEDTSWHQFAFFAMAEAVVYWRIGHHVGELAARTTSVASGV